MCDNAYTVGMVLAVRRFIASFFSFFFFLYLSATRLMRSRDGHFCCVPSRGSEIKTELVFNPASVHYDTNMRIT